MAWEFPRDAVCPRDTAGLERWDGGPYRELYRIKHGIAAELRPKSILEIGVRAGYSALAFLAACPGACYIGLDAENGAHGGQGGPWIPWARGLLKPYNASIRITNTQHIRSLRGAFLQIWGREMGADLSLGFDLIHVDGDHTEAGCSHDLGLALGVLAPGGAVLADDYRSGGVRRAVDEFALAHGMALEIRGSPRGEAILRTARP
jgi:predicted O-methyltransferase YrrM